jgi:hypothetical protein
MAWHPIPTYTDAPSAQTAPPPAVAAAGSSVKAAQAKLTSLKNQRSAAVQRIADCASIRERVAFDSATGSREARKALEAATAESLHAALTLENLDHAIAEAARRVAGAQAAEQRAEQRAAAQQASEISQQMDEAGQLAGEALIALVARISRFMDLADAANKLGHGPSGGLVAANVRRSLGNALAPLGCGERQPPSQRVELGALLHHYASSTARSANSVIGSETTEAV